jgi:DEAD/DEAH box helicase domain-containing protein
MTAEALDYLTDHGVLHASEGAYSWIADAYPATHVSLRSVGWDNVVVVDRNEEKGDTTVLGEVDFRSAHTMLHEQAIYQHDARTFEVVRLDLPNKKAFVRAVEPDYYTTAMTATKVLALRVTEEGGAGGGHAAWGDVRVTEKVTGYKKLKFETHENVGYGDVRLPDREMQTTAFWIEVDAAEADAMKVPRATLADGLCGLSQALHTVACLERMCDPRDIGTAIEETDEDRLRLYLFDAYPGGIGLSGPTFASRGRSLDRAAGLVRSCPCESGCPGCVGPVSIPTAPTRKAMALAILGRLRAS